MRVCVLSKWESKKRWKQWAKSYCCCLSKKNERQGQKWERKIPFTNLVQSHIVHKAFGLLNRYVLVSTDNLQFVHEWNTLGQYELHRILADVSYICMRISSTRFVPVRVQSISMDETKCFYASLEIMKHWRQFRSWNAICRWTTITPWLLLTQSTGAP